VFAFKKSFLFKRWFFCNLAERAFVFDFELLGRLYLLCNFVIYEVVLERNEAVDLLQVVQRRVHSFIG
jgi:hypothetical protein